MAQQPPLSSGGNSSATDDAHEHTGLLESLLVINVDEDSDVGASEMETVLSSRPCEASAAAAAPPPQRTGPRPGSASPRHQAVTYTVSVDEDDWPPLLPSRPRLIPRRRAFHQATGAFRITRHVPRDASNLIRTDWYHWMLHMPTWRLVFWLCILYLTVVLVFSTLLYILPDACKLKLPSYTAAMMLAMSTMSTLGYGAPDIYWNSCREGPPVLLLILLVAMSLNAIWIGTFYARFARPTIRANSVLFSDKAVIRKIGGHWYFMLQASEMRRRALLESHIRLYAIRHLEAPKTPTLMTNSGQRNVYFQTHHMRLQHPNDELGGYLLLNLPNIIVHRIDGWSPLMPPEMARDSRSNRAHDKRCDFTFPTVLLREVDTEVGSRDGGPNKIFADPTEDDFRNYFERCQTEVVIIVEGIDAETTASIQARHSYKLENMKFHETFAPCVSVGQVGECVLDFSKFHDLIPAPPCEEDAFVQSIL